jgi:hypothetical protein
MLEDNEEITISGEKLIDALSIIEFFLISFKNITRYYYDNVYPNIDRVGYEKEITRFINNKHLIQELARLRAILSENFNDELGIDDMDDIERAMEKIKYWEKPGD